MNDDCAKLNFARRVALWFCYVVYWLGMLSVIALSGAQANFSHAYYDLEHRFLEGQAECAAQFQRFIEEQYAIFGFDLCRVWAVCCLWLIILKIMGGVSRLFAWQRIGAFLSAVYLWATRCVLLGGMTYVVCGQIVSWQRVEALQIALRNCNYQPVGEIDVLMNDMARTGPILFVLLLILLALHFVVVSWLRKGKGRDRRGAAVSAKPALPADAHTRER